MAKNINKMSEKIRHFGAEEENKPAKPNHSALVECTLSLDQRPGLKSEFYLCPAVESMDKLPNFSRPQFFYLAFFTGKNKVKEKQDCI